MIKLYLFERNVFTAIFFTPLSQQVIRNHISETEKSTKKRFFMKVYTQVGGEIGHSEGKNLGSKGPARYIQPRPLMRRTLAGLECIGKSYATTVYKCDDEKMTPSLSETTVTSVDNVFLRRKLRYSVRRAVHNIMYGTNIF